MPCDIHPGKMMRSSTRIFPDRPKSPGGQKSYGLEDVVAKVLGIREKRLC